MSPSISTEAVSDSLPRDSAGVRLDRGPDGIATAVFDRPHVKNAIDWETYQSLDRLLEQVGRMASVRVLLLRGAGAAFCAGGDIGFMRQMYEGIIDPQLVQDTARRVFTSLVNLPQPTIAVVDGPAIGLGCTLALACDIVLAGERAVFADPHLQMGLVPGDGGVIAWILRAGPAKAKEHLFTGDPLTAAEAHASGLVNHIYPSGDLLAGAEAFAARLASGPAQALQATKALTNHTWRQLGEGIVRAGLALELASQHSPYHRMAVERFLAGQPMKF